MVANDFSVLLELRRPDYDDTFRQADEEEIIEKVENLTVCPLFHNMSLKKLLRISYSSKITTFTKDQTILAEGVRSTQVYFVISGLVAGSTVVRTPTQNYLARLGNQTAGAILGVEAAVTKDGASNFTYVALSEVRVLICQTAALTRRCTKEFAAALAEYADACLDRDEVNELVLRETDWIKTRSEHHLSATGLCPLPPPPSLKPAGEARGGVDRKEMKLAAQSLANLQPKTAAASRRHSGRPGSGVPRLPAMTPRGSHSHETPRPSPRRTLLGRGGEADNGERGSLLAAIDNSEAEMAKTKLLTEDLKERMGSLIDLRAEQAGRSTPTPPEIADEPSEAYRRSLQMRLWDPLVRLNHLAPGQKKQAEEPAEEAAPPMEVDLSRRLPKQFGLFTEMVYGVTVLYTTITCNTSGVPGLAWLYFVDRLNRVFEEQGVMRGLMRSQHREVTSEASFMLVGGMPHTKSYNGHADSAERAAGLVCDVAMRMIEDTDASNKQHEMEMRHHEALASTGATAAAAEPQNKSFDVGIRIGISTGSVAINVFGTRSPVYFGACGSEVDIAHSLANAQAVPGAGARQGEGRKGMAVLSDSANALVKERYFTAPTEFAKRDSSGNATVLKGHALSGKKETFSASLKTSLASGSSSTGGVSPRGSAGGVSPRASVAGSSPRRGSERLSNGSAQHLFRAGQMGTSPARARALSARLSAASPRAVSVPHVLR